MYENLSSYQREQLRNSQNVFEREAGIPLAKSPQDDQQISDEYQAILRYEGLQYEYFFEGLDYDQPPVW